MLLPTFNTSLLFGIFLLSTTILSAQVTINEIVASNDATAADEFGEFDDWIELYNTGDVPVDISNWYLSDDPDDLLQWQFPENTTIAADDYLIVWADKDEEQGPLHANFKLSAAGETLYLLNVEGNIVEEIIFGEQTTDVAYARIPNGIGDFTADEPTFGFNNDITSTLEVGTYLKAIAAFPNPTPNMIELQSTFAEPVDVAIELRGGMTGTVLHRERQQGTDIHTTVDLTNLPSGWYVLLLQSPKGIWRQLVMKQ